MTVQDVIRVELAMLAWREARHYGGINNMLAVAFVVKNRVDAGWLGGDWMQIIANHEQWSARLVTAPALQGETQMAPVPDFHDPDVRDLIVEVDGIFDGTAEDTFTDGALYYCELDRVERPWFLQNVVRRPDAHARVATVGPVSFFR